MFERIISINNNYAIVKISNNFNNDILNYNVIFDESNKKILGEINEVINFEAKISFLGEFIDNNFFSGVIRKPSLNCMIRIINQQELGELVGSINNRAISFGTCPLYNNFPVKVDINELFGNHTLILGNSNVGKTNCAKNIINNLFSMKDKLPFNSNIFIFSDSFEYKDTFEQINKIHSSFNYKMYSFDGNNSIKIPLWMLDLYDFSHLLEADNYFQVTIIEKMLKYVSIFAKNDENSKKYKNNLIASALMRIIYSNQINTRIREQICEVLNCCNTQELNLNRDVPGIGYNKKFLKCLDLDKNGEFVEREILIKYIQKFICNNDKFNSNDDICYYTLEQLVDSLSFVFISEGIIFNEKLYFDAMKIKDNLNKIVNSRYREIFDVSNFVTIDQFINTLFTANNTRYQIVNFIFDNIDFSLANSLEKILSKIMYNYNVISNSGLPIYMLYDLSNNYIQSGKDNELFGYSIYDKIFRDGSKYGISINLVTDNVTSIDKKILASFENYIVFQLNNECDIDYLKNYIPKINSHMIEKIKSLQVGTCLCFGNIIKIPMIVRMEIISGFRKEISLLYDKWIVDFKK